MTASAMTAGLSSDTKHAIIEKLIRLNQITHARGAVFCDGSPAEMVRYGVMWDVLDEESARIREQINHLIPVPA